VPTPTLPDTIAVVREALLAQTPITALVAGRIYDRIPAAPTWPLLVLDTVDEAEVDWYRWQARVQVNCWGPGPSSADEQAARVLAMTVVAVSRDLRGPWTAGHIVNTWQVNMIPAPDDTTGRARFVVDVMVETMP
jgi:hypothetical protein